MSNSSNAKPGAMAGAVLAGALALSGCGSDDLPEQGTKVGGLVFGTEHKVADIVAPHVGQAEARLVPALEKFTAGSLATLDAAEKRLEAAGLDKSCANLNDQECFELTKLAHEVLGTMIDACGPETFKYNGGVETGNLEKMTIPDLKARVVSAKADYVWDFRVKGMVEKNFSNLAPSILGIGALVLLTGLSIIAAAKKNK